MEEKEDASEILLGSMSISTDKYVREMPHLKGWILDAMEQYANQRVIEELENICNDEESEYIRYRIKELNK
tara:strand:- start:444 stop:656 length:213 start_codon:yes stop_codon:yes gene_type:complete